MAGARKPRAFVLISFEDQFESVHEELIKAPLVELGYDVERADSRLNQQNILRDIVRGIASADLIVADLTGLNPNVFYELGLAHALEVPTILITQSIEEIPFDLRAYRANEYSIHFVEAPKLREKIKEIAEGRISGAISFGSPVTDFLPSDFKPKRPAAPAMVASEEERQETVATADSPADGGGGAEEEGELGWFDALQLSDEAATRFSEASERLTAATEAVGNQIVVHTGEYERLSTSPDPDRIKQTGSLNIRVANDLDEYAKATEQEVPLLEESAVQLMDAMDQYLAWIRSQPESETEEERESLRTTAQTLREATGSNLESMREFRGTISALRGFSRPINSAITRVLKALDQVITLTETIEARTARIVTVITSLAESAQRENGKSASTKPPKKKTGATGAARSGRSGQSKKRPRPAT